MKLTRYLLGVCLLVCSIQGSALDKDGKGLVWDYPCADYIKAYPIQMNTNEPDGLIHRNFALQGGFIQG